MQNLIVDHHLHRMQSLFFSDMNPLQVVVDPWESLETTLSVEGLYCSSIPVFTTQVHIVE